MYGYLIGLDVGVDFELQKNFSFLSKLLKSVKSKIFNDIESENCIVFNTETGCFACRARILKYEEERFDEMKKLHFDDFYSVLKNVFTYEQFVEEEIHLRPEFLKIYEQFYKRPKKERMKLEADSLDDEELNGKLIENNREILEVIELSEMRFNVMKDVPCHEFFDHSDAYKLKGMFYSFYLFFKAKMIEISKG